jgi:phosphatidylglycerol:prolipoprotein diacylglycerol transferase
VERPFWPLADLLVPGVALGEAVGWVGCLGSGCGYGLPARGPWAYELPDIYGIVVPRFPTQALASLVSGLIFALLIFVLWRYGSRLVPGSLASLYLLLSALGHFLVEFTRGDETLYLGLLRWSQWAEAGEIILALSMLAYLWKLGRRRRVRETP